MRVTRKSTSHKLLLSLTALGGVLTLLGLGTWAAFTSVSENSGNTFQAGSVKLSDDDADGRLFDLTNLKPNQTAARCIKVSYTGTLPASVHLYGTGGGNGLANYLDVKVTKGSGGNNFPSCNGFTADTADYNNSGAGVIYDGTLADYPSSFNQGLVDPDASGAESWTENESHVYRFDVTLKDDDAAEELEANQVFNWQARNQ